VGKGEGGQRIIKKEVTSSWREGRRSWKGAKKADQGAQMKEDWGDKCGEGSQRGMWKKNGYRDWTENKKNARRQCIRGQTKTASRPRRPKPHKPREKIKKKKKPKKKKPKKNRFIIPEDASQDLNAINNPQKKKE